jgi:dipeptidyl aminopeptidase/acylaminoacyl peptidase
VADDLDGLLTFLGTDCSGGTTAPTPSPAASSPTGSPSIGAVEQIAFASDRDGNREIYVMSADGTGLERVTNDPAEDGQPAWSPDGTEIAFSSNRDGNFEIYVMSADGTGERRLTNGSESDQSPAWSPDGTEIAYFSNRVGGFDI